VHMGNFHFSRSLAIPAIFFISISIAFFSPNTAVASRMLLIVVDTVIWRLASRSLSEHTCRLARTPTRQCWLDRGTP
jgi:hypothetical protein